MSTSSARESHEWDGFQAGVFSHEVRSGLYGAADADGDGRVSYREIAAFISRANAAIPNERFRPNVLARPPRHSSTLLDLRDGLARRLDIDAAHAGHYWIEDSRGVRLLDLHNGRGQAVHLVRPAPSGPVYVRRVDDDAEFSLPPGPDVISLGELEARQPRVASRGAAHDAYTLVFSLPFDRDVVATYVEPPEPRFLTDDRMLANARKPAWRTGIGWSALGLGVAALGTGIGFSISAVTLADGVSPLESQAAVSERNARISTRNTVAAIGYVAGAGSTAAGLLLLLWPDSRHLQANVSSSGFSFGYATSY